MQMSVKRRKTRLASRNSVRSGRSRDTAMFWTLGKRTANIRAAARCQAHEGAALQTFAREYLMQVVMHRDMYIAY